MQYVVKTIVRAIAQIAVIRRPLRSLCSRVGEFLFDLVFPASERAKRIEQWQCPLPTDPQTRNAGRRAIIFLAQYEGRVRECICALKFERNMRAATLLADMLDDFLVEHLAERSVFGAPDIYCVPIPLGPERLRTRGLNQVEEVRLRTHAVQSKQLTVISALARTRDTVMQSTLPRAERLINMRGAFAVTDAWREKIRGRHILLIDDVTTTGATLSEAAMALKAAGATVECIALSG